jgi:hypothetical protein
MKPGQALVIAIAVGAALSACGSVSAETRTVNFDGFQVSITLGRNGLLGGCRIVDAELQNTGTKPLNFVYGVLVIEKDGETIGSDGLNFYPTEPGGRSRIAHLDFGGLATAKCEDLQIRYNIP